MDRKPLHGFAERDLSGREKTDVTVGTYSEGDRRETQKDEDGNGNDDAAVYVW